MEISQPVSNYIAKSILTTEGDLLVQGASAAQRLAAAAADLVLTANGASTVPSYQDPHKILITQGDLLVRGAAAASRLAIGAADLVLTSNGAGADPSWQDPHKILTTQGDMLIRGAAGPQRLPADADGEVLTSNGPGTNPSYQFPHDLWAFNLGAAFNLHIIEIGDWNMDTTNSVTVAHGLSFADIIWAGCWIRNDTNDGKWPLTWASATVANGDIRVNATFVILARRAGGAWDSIAYDSTSYNRGWIFLLALV